MIYFIIWLFQFVIRYVEDTGACEVFISEPVTHKKAAPTEIDFSHKKITIFEDGVFKSFLT